MSQQRGKKDLSLYIFVHMEKARRSQFPSPAIPSHSLCIWRTCKGSNNNPVLQRFQILFYLGSRAALSSLGFCT